MTGVRIALDQVSDLNSKFHVLSFILSRMRFVCRQLTDNITTVLRRLGYIFQYEKDGEMSFVRPLARAGFPRFHCYAKIEKQQYVFSMHLDQKRETYGQETRHHGEYTPDGALKEELSRIETQVGPLTRLA